SIPPVSKPFQGLFAQTLKRPDAGSAKRRFDLFNHTRAQQRHAYIALGTKPRSLYDLRGSDRLTRRNAVGKARVRFTAKRYLGKSFTHQRQRLAKRSAVLVICRQNTQRRITVAEHKRLPQQARVSRSLRRLCCF